MLYINYAKCGTCKKAKAWLDANDIKYIDKSKKNCNHTD